MAPNYDAYEIVVGLEVHAQLLTQSKLFCGDSAAFGAAPNTHVSPITLGHPGTLPKLNRQAVHFAIKMGLACHCNIQRVNYFARKNYFYPDLPKGYQISQHTTPLCMGGYVTIHTDHGERSVQLNRIHLEEDAGKSIHDSDPHYTSVDYNRAGVPLIEIVSEPDMHSSEEAFAYVTELRKILRYLKICDGNMEEGSLRCDANVSVRKKGEKTLGTKVEVKNLNSIRNVKRAIDHEADRMIQLLEAGQQIVQQTRSFDAVNGTSFPLRLKEEANDYRYFTDPDIPPFQVNEELLVSIRESLPVLPEALLHKYRNLFNLTEYDARVICDDKETADYFNELTDSTTHYKAAANWLLGPVKSYLNEKGIGINDFPVSPKQLSVLIQMVQDSKLSFSAASSRIFPELIRQPSTDPMVLATRLNLLQNSDSSEIEKWVLEALDKMPEKVQEYKKGKKGLIGLFVGEVKRISKGKADPKLTNQLLLEKLEN